MPPQTYHAQKINEWLHDIVSPYFVHEKCYGPRTSHTIPCVYTYLCSTGITLFINYLFHRDNTYSSIINTFGGHQSWIPNDFLILCWWCFFYFGFLVCALLLNKSAVTTKYTHTQELNFNFHNKFIPNRFCLVIKLITKRRITHIRHLFNSFSIYVLHWNK